MSLLNTIQTGQSGLRVASSALSVVGQNTANAATEGYSRQQISTSAADPYANSGLWIGTGVTADAIGRVTDVFVSERLTDARGDAANAEASYQTHRVIESSVTGEGGVADTLTAFFDALDALKSDPGDSGYRLSVIAAGETLATSVNQSTSQLDGIQTGIEERIVSTADDLNSALTRIADLNGRISEGGSADLADERDRLIGDLATSLGVSADFSSNSGEATVFLGGHAIVMGNHARTLTIDLDAGSPTVQISADDATITVTDDVGGEIGGLLAAWDTAESVQSDLDTFVVGFADAFNTQHALGFDASGSPGGDFFTYSAGEPAGSFSISSDILGDETLLALADDPSALIGDKGNLDALSALQDSPLIDGETPEDFMAQVYAGIGASVSRAEATYSTELASLQDAEALQESISGVDLDEEAGKLLEWQAAYQASARVISASNELLAELMSIV